MAHHQLFTFYNRIARQLWDLSGPERRTVDVCVSRARVQGYNACAHTQFIDMYTLLHRLFEHQNIPLQNLVKLEAKWSGSCEMRATDFIPAGKHETSYSAHCSALRKT